MDSGDDAQLEAFDALVGVPRSVGVQSQAHADSFGAQAAGLTTWGQLPRNPERYGAIR